MGRILFFVALAAALYLLWRSLKGGATRRSGDGGGATSRPALAMVSCAHCGLHLPRPDAVVEGERFYCSEEHRGRGPAAG